MFVGTESTFGTASSKSHDQVNPGCAWQKVVRRKDRVHRAAMTREIEMENDEGRQSEMKLALGES